MAKRLYGEYMEVPKIFWDKFSKGRLVEISRFRTLSVHAKWVYITLRDLENTYTGSDNTKIKVYYEGVENTANWFYCDNKRLAHQAGLSESTIKKAKKELIECELIRTCRVFFIDEKGRRKERWVTGYYVYEGDERAFQIM